MITYSASSTLKLPTLYKLFFAYEHQIKYLKGLRGFNHYFIGIKWQFMSICLIWFPPTAKFVWCLVKSLELVIRRKHLNVNSSTLLKTRACPIEKFNKIAFRIGILSINLQTRKKFPIFPVLPFLWNWYMGTSLTSLTCVAS